MKTRSRAGTCPGASNDILEVMLLVSRIQALTSIDPGYRHAKSVVHRLRHPLWDELSEGDRERLHGAADAIVRACRLREEDVKDIEEVKLGAQTRTGSGSEQGEEVGHRIGQPRLQRQLRRLA